MIHDLRSKWAVDESCPHADYPRPQLKRSGWQCLNGTWEYAIRDDLLPPKQYDGNILVPFSPECMLSGVKRQVMPWQTLWYRRKVSLQAPENGRLLLHFGAVDQICKVYVNEHEVGEHYGGYWPFSFDITDYVIEGENVLSLSVRDYSDRGIEAYGKQKLERGGIWYTGQSGIWQTVWLEIVPEQHITAIKITPNCKAAEVAVNVCFSRPLLSPVLVRVFYEGNTIVSEQFDSSDFRISLPDFRYWCPDDPFLYSIEICAGDDVVESYFGMREFSINRDANGHMRMFLNGNPIFHSGLLDQGYWSDGMYTPPCDEAMVWEITQVKNLGFNMLRKHIKIEPLRWYYHCDRLGILVWQDFVNGGGPYSPWVIQYLPFVGVHLRDKAGSAGFGRLNREGLEIFRRDMERTVDLLYNVVGLCCWVPFNEGWGQFDAVRIADELRGLDLTRHIDHASGWHDQRHGDFSSIHVYYKPFRMKADSSRVIALTEFGGFSCPTQGHMSSDKLFGYRMFKDSQLLSFAFAKLYEDEVIPAVKKGLSAAIYTQVSDVEDEINGLFTYDRAVIKVDADTVKGINEKLYMSMGGLS